MKLKLTSNPHRSTWSNQTTYYDTYTLKGEADNWSTIAIDVEMVITHDSARVSLGLPFHMSPNDIAIIPPKLKQAAKDAKLLQAMWTKHVAQCLHYYVTDKIEEFCRINDVLVKDAEWEDWRALEREARDQRVLAEAERMQERKNREAAKLAA